MPTKATTAGRQRVFLCTSFSKNFNSLTCYIQTSYLGNMLGKQCCLSQSRQSQENYSKRSTDQIVWFLASRGLGGPTLSSAVKQLITRLWIFSIPLNSRSNKDATLDKQRSKHTHSENVDAMIYANETEIAAWLRPEYMVWHVQLSKYLCCRCHCVLMAFPSAWPHLSTLYKKKPQP